MAVSVLLICAVLASLAAGVLLAYGVCLLMFGIFRMHARQLHLSRNVPAPQPALES